MKRHGATVVGGGLKELVSRSIFLCQNAEYQMRAHLLGAPALLHPARIELAGQSKIDARGRSPGHGNIGHMRLIEAGGLPPRPAREDGSARARPNPRRGSPRKNKKRR